jgi:hypothetical protein
MNTIVPLYVAFPPRQKMTVYFLTVIRFNFWSPWECSTMTVIVIELIIYFAFFQNESRLERSSSKCDKRLLQCLRSSATTCQSSYSGMEKTLGCQNRISRQSSSGSSIFQFLDIFLRKWFFLLFHCSNCCMKVVNSSLYYILSSVREDWPWSLSPGSLSSNGYKYWLFHWINFHDAQNVLNQITCVSGHVFWDTETWMYPSTPSLGDTFYSVPWNF